MWALHTAIIATDVGGIEVKGTSTGRLLVITAIRNRSNSYITDWLSAFKKRTDFRTLHIDALNPGSTTRVRQALKEVDAVVLLHSVTADSLRPAHKLKSVLAERNSPIAVLVGNEINLPWAPLSEKIQFLSDIGVDIVGTQLLEEAGQYLYGRTGAMVLPVPHAVDPTQFAYRQPGPAENLTIGTRTAQYLPIIGDRDRPRLLDAVAEIAASKGWVVDISDNRFATKAWSEYLTSLDVTASTEAGSFYTDRSDVLVVEILDYIRQRNQSVSIPVSGLVSDVLRYLPWRLRQWLRTVTPGGMVTNDLKMLEDAPADQIIEQFFSTRISPPAYMKALSSRHIEAASVGTPQLLLEGRYNDVLVPNRHYVSVRNDLSNLNTALDQLSDVGERIRIAEAARGHVEQFHTLDLRIDSLLDSFTKAWH